MKKFSLLLFLQLFIVQNCFAKNDVFLHPIATKDLPKIKEMMPQGSILRSNFKQIKTINGLVKPLISSGYLLFSKEHGIYWQTKKPFSATLIFTKNDLIQIIDGKKETIATGDSIIFQQFSEILQSILLNDQDKIKNYFEIFFLKQNASWTLGLKPRNAQIKSALTEIIIKGAVNIQEIELSEESGDKTLIKLQTLKNSAASLTKNEKLYFNL